MIYAAHAAFVAPARVRPEIWRLAAGLALGVVVIVAAGQIVAAGAALGRAGGLWQGGAGRGETPGGALVLLFSFAALAAGAAAAARFVHRRPARSLIGPPRAARRDFLRVGGVLALLYGVILLLPPWAPPEGTAPGLAIGTWVLLLPLSLAATLVQVGSEEIAFRGYLQQQLAARFAAPVVWMGVPSALFAAIHYNPGLLGGNAATITLWAGLAGLAMADLTARAGNLGPAIAMHFFINAPTFLFIAPAGFLSGLALWVMPHGLDDAAVRTALPMEFVMLALTWLAARLALRQ
jgi:uncharacterized protein